MLPVTSLLSSAVLADAMAEVEDAQSLLQAALAHASSEASTRDRARARLFLEGPEQPYKAFQGLVRPLRAL